MPYVITTKRKMATAPIGAFQVESRRAAATLEEARKAAHDTMFDRAMESAWAEGSNAANWQAVNDLPESGGTVGPLPDGTVIEVVCDGA